MVGVAAVVFGAPGIAWADSADSGSKPPTSSASADSSESNVSANVEDSASTGSSLRKELHTGTAHTSSTASDGDGDGSPAQTKRRPKHKVLPGASPPAHSTSATDTSVKAASSAAVAAGAALPSDPAGAPSDAAISVAVPAVTPSVTATATTSLAGAPAAEAQPSRATSAAASPNLLTVITTAIGNLFAPLWSPSAGNTPTSPAQTPITWMMLAAARRETSSAPTSLSPAADPVTNSLTTAQTASSAGVTGLFQSVVYAPLHTLMEDWIDSGPGQLVDGLINTVAGSYVIGNGTPGTAADPTGGSGGWLIGDGGGGWDSTKAGVAGGDGGAAGILGDGGTGGSGGAGAAGGAGGGGGFVMGIGGDGGAGGADSSGGAGGSGGVGGPGTGLVFGIGGRGGDGGYGSDGGRGGDGGNGATLLGTGGDGGDGGNSGVGGTSTGLPALGGAGGNAGYLGTHGQVGRSGTGAAATQASGSLLPISTTGTWLTNSNGQVVLMHGLNEVYKEAPFEPSASGFSNDDAAFLAANGFNVVRLGVIWAGVEPQPGVYDTAYIDSIQQTVQTLANHGIYTILDFHQDEYSSEYGGEGAPAWASQSGGLPNTSLSFPINEFVDPAENHAWDSFWSNSQAPNGLGLEDDYTQMLETVASNFSGNTDVLGYEIMNEPYPGSQALPTLLGSPFFDTEELNPFYDQAAQAIRAVDPSTPIFYEQNLISDFGIPTKLGSVDTSNTVFSYHNYLPNYIPIPVISAIVVDEAQAYAKALDIPAFMTEFGATNSQSSLTASTQPVDADLTSWTEWTYSGQGDITTAGNTNSESLVYNPALPPTGDNVNTANLTTLAEPYPQTVSGIPTAFSFTNGTFTFSYSTERADGSGSFAAGAQTDISVPAIEFPNGYQVSVTGGQVVSAPNAAVLVIAADDATSTVDVVVTPASSAQQAGSPV